MPKSRPNSEHESSSYNETIKQNNQSIFARILWMFFGYKSPNENKFMQENEIYNKNEEKKL